MRAEPDALDSAAEIADRGFDAKVDLSVAGKSLVLLLEIKKAVYPGMYANCFGSSRP